MIKKLLLSIWKDPVWSKVIAAAIIGIAISVYSGMAGLVRNENFFSGLAGFWQYKLSLWVYFIVSAGIIIIVAVFTSRKNKRMEETRRPNDGKPATRPLFQSTKANPYEYELNEIRLWDSSSKQFYGEEGRGNLSIQDGTITIQRTNKEGRVMLRLKRYLNGLGKTDYVKSDVSGSTTRTLRVSFECRVLGGKHRLGIIALRRDASWITSKKFDLANGDWEPYQTYLLDIPATENFFVEFEDSQNERENSGLQLRNVVIEEIIH